MRALKQSTAANVMLLMVDSTDHVTGKTGLTLTLTLSKDGGAFNSISPTVTERGNGWYSIALTTAHTDTLGDLVIRATGTAADPAERVFWVAARVNDDFAYPNVSGRGIDVDATGGVEITTGQSVNVASISASAITAASIAASALNGKGDWNIGKTGYSLTQSFPANFASMAITVGGAVTAGTVSDKTGYSLSGTQTFNLTGSITGNLSGSVGSVTGLTAADVAAIKAKTDSLTFTVPGQVDANIQYVNDVQVTGDGQSGTEWGPV